MPNELLERGVAEVIEAEHLAKRLQAGEKLRVKLGIDPTSPDLHLGHTVPLRKLRQFQDAGHTAVLIIGDYTARIGDPSGRDKTRPTLSADHIKQHVKTYQDQLFRILDPDKTELRHQSQWYKDFGLDKLTELASKVSTWHLLSHETFGARKKRGEPLMHHETVYPLLQGYDSVAVKADVELGGTDQKFNLLTGRMVQQAYHQSPQDVVLLPYLLGTDGKQKMSKSFGNTINLTDEPNEMYGKVMSIPDALIVPYFELVTDVQTKALEKIRQEVKQHPRHAKARLAFLIVESLYDSQAAQEAQEAFDHQYRDRKPPEALNEVTLPDKATILEALIVGDLAGSRQEALRLIDQGGVRVDGKKVSDPKTAVKPSSVVQVGKRRFVRIKE